MRNPSAAQPRIGTSAMYRMLSQWTSPDRNVMALPAEYGISGRKSSTAAVVTRTPTAKWRGDRGVDRPRHTSQPARPTSARVASAAYARGQSA